MQQRTRRLAIFFGASLIAAAGVLVACSTDNGNTPLPGTGGDGGGGGKDGSKADGGDDDDGDGSSVKKDATANCDGAPKPRSNDDGVFCFGGAGSNDAGICEAAENSICCADEKDDTGQFLKARCATTTVAGEGYNTGACNFAKPDSGREWHCTEPKHCPNSGESCCVIPGLGGNPQAQPDTKEFPGCGNFFNNDQGFFVGGSRCRADGCQAQELTLCTSDDECETGKCHFFKIANRFTGVCQ